MNIAVVGIGGVIPGCESLLDFWNLSLSGLDAVSDLDRSHPSLRDLVSDFDTKDRVLHNRLCAVAPFKLDLHGLDVDRALVERLDPLFKYCLKAGRDAFFDSQWQSIDRSRAGVILGITALPTETSTCLSHEIFTSSLYESLDGFPAAGISQDPLNSFIASSPAALLAKALGFRQEAYTLDAGSSSALYGIKLACQRLETRDVDAMLVGGMQKSDYLYLQMAFTQLQSLSPSGICRPFDEDGDGLLLGEGGAMFLLKRVEDAVLAGDHIYGVIRGVGLAQDYADPGESEAGKTAILEAYDQASWQIGAVDYMECHATGVAQQDRTELDIYKNLWGPQNASCVLSSVKGQIGHLLGGAGAVGLLQVLLALHRKRIPASIHFHSNPLIDDSPFRVLKTSEAWPSGNHGRKAAVSTFEPGGVYAHLLVEEFRKTSNLSYDKQESPSKTRPPVAIIGIGSRLSSQRSIWDPLSWRHSLPNKRRWFGVDSSLWYRKDHLALDHRVHQFEDIMVPQPFLGLAPQDIKAMKPRQLLALLVGEEALQDAQLSSQSELDCGLFFGGDLDSEVHYVMTRWAMEQRGKVWNSSGHGDLNKEEEETWLESLKDACWPPLRGRDVQGAFGWRTLVPLAKHYQILRPPCLVAAGEHSGLYALKLAMEQIQNGDIPLGLVCAADLAGDVLKVISQSRWERAQGLDLERQWEDGSLALVLKDYGTAIADGNKIYGVIEDLQIKSSGTASSLWPAKTDIVQLVGDMCPARPYLYRSETSLVSATLRDRDLLETLEKNHLHSQGQGFPIPEHNWYQGAASNLIRLVETMLQFQEARRGGWQPQEYCLLSFGARDGGVGVARLKGHEQSMKQVPKTLVEKEGLPYLRVPLAGNQIILPMPPAKGRSFGGSISRKKANITAPGELPSQTKIVDVQGAVELPQRTFKDDGNLRGGPSQERQWQDFSGASSLGLFTPSYHIEENQGVGASADILPFPLESIKPSGVGGLSEQVPIESAFFGGYYPSRNIQAHQSFEISGPAGPLRILTMETWGGAYNSGFLMAELDSLDSCFGTCPHGEGFINPMVNLCLVLLMYYFKAHGLKLDSEQEYWEPQWYQRSKSLVMTDQWPQSGGLLQIDIKGAGYAPHFMTLLDAELRSESATVLVLKDFAVISSPSKNM